MSQSTERQIEAAEAAVVAATQRTIATIKAGLAAQGAADCDDCGDVIPAARRKALPSARRCVRCQDKHERRGF